MFGFLFASVDSEHLIADPKRASELRLIFHEGPHGIFRRIWPWYKNTAMFTTGAFSHYSKILLSSVLDGTLVTSPFHSATEGVFGINLSPGQNPIKTSYTTCIFLVQEFLPLSELVEGTGDNMKELQTLFPEQVHTLFYITRIKW